MTRKILMQLAGVGALAMAAAGCSVPPGSEICGLIACPSAPESRSLAFPGGASSPAQANDMATLTYGAAQVLMDRAQGLAKDKPIVVATIVSVDDLNASSTFGRLAEELVADRIEQRGYLVREIRYMHALELSPTGELVLSRDARKVSESNDAQAIVAGTYAIAGEKVYLNLRLLRGENGEVLSSVDVAIPLNENTAPMVGAFGSDKLVSYDEAFPAQH